jgi:ubiquitin-protein ligase
VTSVQDLIGLGANWKPVKYVTEYIGNVVQLLREPSPDDALEKTEAFHLFLSDRAAFNDRARRFTREHAM